MNAHDFPISLGNQPSELAGVDEQPSAQEDITAGLLASSPMTLTDEPSASSSVMAELSASAPVIAEPSTSVLVIVEPSVSDDIVTEPPALAYNLAESVASSSLINYEATTYSTSLGPLNTTVSQERDSGEVTENSSSQREDRKSQRLVTPRLSINQENETAIPSWVDMVGTLNEPDMFGTLNEPDMVRTLDGPNLMRAELYTLESMVLFGIAGAVSEEMEEKFASNREDNLSRLSLNAIPNAMEYLKRVLKAENPSEAIARCVEEIDVSTYNGQFLAIMQGTLNDFCTMRRTKTNFKYPDDHERTYWIDSVAPMFKYFSTITDLVSFIWGETVTMRIDFASYFDDIEGLDPDHYVDGLGESEYGKCIVMEASGDSLPEDDLNTMDDTAKLLQTAIGILTDYQVDCKYAASFSTFTKLQILTVRSFKDSMTLYGVSVTAEKKMYEYLTLRTARIPVFWEHREDWYSMFELLAVVMAILQEQEQVHLQLLEEMRHEVVPSVAGPP
ncbi:hypothetical protein K450DRAFT_284073 [Umbelopsis ramanniana AG]|uniref:Uncharacterized protein n=1 Tax=Umbelopsis ramanniana AG TaxID=1314678 RepID=A0AAD5E533_UMBRA|nr:uncharacterized protein K450DRAFT_284073 [Umbelopsis ramanniana AG]KAI8575785.1 hypothetical protein K450DRAFT_284073 [Umbelopsis ramanniana AG]